MRRLRFLTAGESHGPALVGILEGLPAGLRLQASQIEFELKRRQRGHGRGGRMRIENDSAEILSGVRLGKTLGSPVALLIRNLDFENWKTRMQVAPGEADEHPVLIPRPGHADLAGALKYGHTQDVRNVLERASARETAMRVGLGALAKTLLWEVGIEVGSYVRSVGAREGLSVSDWAPKSLALHALEVSQQADFSATRALDEASTSGFVEEIQKAQALRDTVGGVFEVVVTGLPVGLGSHVHWDRRLDGRLAQALMSIPAVKGVEIGDGFQAAQNLGSQVHDAIAWQQGRIQRSQNRAGGLEGGLTNGQPLVLRAAMKPLSTLSKALPSVNLQTLRESPAHVERSDTCAVPAASVIGEAMVSWVLADALLETLGGDTLADVRRECARLRMLPRGDRGHLYLFGPMGSGKSSVGRLLAQKLAKPFIDLDLLVEEQAKLSIPKLFQKEGEAGFRQREWAALSSLEQAPPSVVALGGGTACTDAAWRLLRHSGLIFGLWAPQEVLVQRLAGEPQHVRPLLQDTKMEETMKVLLQQRAPYYEKVDVEISTLGVSPEEVAHRVLGHFEALQGPLTRP